MNDWQVESIDLDIMEKAYSLPEPFHQDPADRIIVATIYDDVPPQAIAEATGSIRMVTSFISPILIILEVLLPEPATSECFLLR